FFKQKTAYEFGLGIPAEPLFRSRRSWSNRSENQLIRKKVLIMFQTFISRHNSNFFSDKLVLTSVTPASSAPVLQTPKATSSTLYFEIGRASCRERVYITVISVSIKTMIATSC